MVVVFNQEIMVVSQVTIASDRGRQSRDIVVNQVTLVVSHVELIVNEVTAFFNQMAGFEVTDFRTCSNSFPIL